MQRYNPFRCTCGKGNIILRTSCQPDTFARKKNYRCGYFDWKDAFDERLMVCSSSTSEGPCRSEPIECSNCKVKDLTINKLESRNRALKARLRMLEARLEMERNPKDHACQSGAILNELLDDMEDLHME
ncbi:hypothetical protein Tco_0417244 [Tanacetum coccineum]